jgi:dienelactone hydrolase
LKTEAKVSKIAVTGYCFGGRFAFRTGAPGKGADVVFAAHPSNLGDAEIKAVDGPAAIAAAGKFFVVVAFLYDFLIGFGEVLRRSGAGRVWVTFGEHSG